MKGRKRLAVLMAIATPRTAAAAALDIDTLVKSATPMSVAQLYPLYRDKSWLWKNGAAFFADTGRFKAWTEDGAAAAYAQGGWWLTEAGALCIKAAWNSAAGSNEQLLCFSHRVTNGVVLQKREPAGNWYVFKSSPSAADDEIQKFKDGDQIEAKFEAVKSALTDSHAATAPGGAQPKP